MKRYGPIALILLIYLVVGSLYAVYTPDWQAPDEPAHYNVVRQLAEGTFPVIEPADYDQDFQGEAISSGFDPAYDVPDRYFSYEDWQPPLYYLLLVPVYGLFEGALEPLRLASLVLGAGVVLLTYGVARLVWRREAWALTAAAFVAFLPQHLAVMASLNNDALAELLIAAILYLLVRGAMRGAVSPLPSPLSPLSVSQSLNLPFPLLLLGILLGLGLLTKGSVYIMAPLMGVVFLWYHWGAWRQVVRVGLIVGGAAALLALPWWVRNSVVYGGLDIIAWQAHGEVVVGQPRTVEWFEQFGVDGTLQRFFTTTFHSFWGQFGWMGVVMPTWVYQLLGLFTGVVGVGLIAAAVQTFQPSRQPPQRHATLPPSTFILLLNLAFTLLLYLGYNITFVQHQGRYLFSALIPWPAASPWAWVRYGIR
ncbi:MAG: glycosyltransferase family 39 protein [Chloroflexi bacterium]|nr:glycosyltransferase family 39 protein [Chloroflexota bacterium]